MNRERERRHRMRRRGGITPEFQERAERELGHLLGRESALVPTSLLHLPKLSDRVIKVAEPLTQAACNPEEIEDALSSAIIAWNMAAMNDPANDAKTWNDVLLDSDLSLEEALVLRQSIITLIRRKRDLFPDDSRIIMDYDISFAATGFHLQVAAGVPESSVLAPRPALAAPGGV